MTAARFCPPASGLGAVLSPLTPLIMTPLLTAAVPPAASAPLVVPPAMGRARHEPGARFTVAVWVPRADLPRVAAALGPDAVVVACDALPAFSTAVRGGAAAGVIGTTCVGEADVADLRALVAERPTTLFNGLAGAVGWTDRETADSCGVRLAVAGVLAVVYPLDASDWHILARSLAGARLADSVQRGCVAEVLTGVWDVYRTDLDDRYHGAPGEPALRAFFAAAYDSDVGAGGDFGDVLEGVAARLGMDAAALEARFVAHGLPDASRYVAAARLVRAAWTGEPVAPGAIDTVVRYADASEPAHVHQAGRRLRRLATRAASAQPGQTSGQAVLRVYREALVLRYAVALGTLDLASETGA